MRRNISFVFLLLAGACFLFSCAKYKAPKAFSDPRDTAHYCNDPLGVNYNWKFPGVPDNSVCFYPTDVFAGKYVFHDSIFVKTGYYFIAADTFILYITKVSNTKMSVAGLCVNGSSILMTASPVFTATVDTLIGDSVTSQGQMLCSLKDTINGTISQNRIDSVLTLNFQVASDTGVITIHTGSATLMR